MSDILITPIAYVANERKEKTDDRWSPIISRIELVAELSESCFDGIAAFPYLEVISSTSIGPLRMPPRGRFITASARAEHLTLL